MDDRKNSPCADLAQASKKRRPNHFSDFHPPPAFWDNLSRIWLTTQALKELDRRNSHVTPSRSDLSTQSVRWPLTQGTLPKWKIEPDRQLDEPHFDFLSHCSLEHLEAIKLFARDGGPDLRDLRAYREPLNHRKQTMSSTQPGSQNLPSPLASVPTLKRTTNASTSGKSGPYDRNFQQHLIDSGVFPNGYEYLDGRLPPQPDNSNVIRHRLRRSRPSLSLSQFSDNKFREFDRAMTHAAKERQVTDSVIPIIEGKVEDARCKSGGIPFTNFDHLTNGQLVPGNPDRYYGARPEQLDRQVRDELSSRIVPSTQKDLPIAPNFFLEIKGPNGTMAVAERQASYYGALGARAIRSLHSYDRDEPVCDNNAHTITSVYNGGLLKIYTSHAVQRAGSTHGLEYFTTQVGAYALTHDRDAFCQGAAAYRNARDWAKEQRDLAIERANERARARRDQVTTV
ncbi:MAG: hypothetical protein M1817_002348 [Caeruleum heppii]|nr:MAG: hypothetical protein M1817_003467 [Caeruleum heppii]KAI9673710.1 MAG: hypothetical protein M1817_002348 [Caeruleum heppii]